MDKVRSDGVEGYGVRAEGSSGEDREGEHCKEGRENPESSACEEVRKSGDATGSVLQTQTGYFLSIQTSSKGWEF